MAERLTPEEIRQELRVLDESPDTDAMGAAAIALAGCENPNAIASLGRLLATNAFLARLDDLSDPSRDTQNLLRIFRTLADHPTEATGQLCEALFDAPDFRSLPARTNMLLGALAAVRPTSERGADVFRASMAEGFTEVIGPLLLANASPLSLKVFEELISSERIDAGVKVSVLHYALLPRRYYLPVLALCERLLALNIGTDVRHALVQTLFDYQSRSWFGPAMNPPKPLAWEITSSDALRILIGMAARLLSQGLDPELQRPVQSTRDELQDLLARRG